MVEDRTEKRQNPRRTVMLTGSVVYNGRRYPCRVRNLSAGGLKLQIDVPLAPGTPVHAELPRFGRFPAVVAWIEGGMIGLVFPESASATLARFGAAAARLGLTDAGDADEPAASASAGR